MLFPITRAREGIYKDPRYLGIRTLYETSVETVSSTVATYSGLRMVQFRTPKGSKMGHFGGPDPEIDLGQRRSGGSGDPVFSLSLL